MVTRLAGSLLHWYAHKRRSAWEAIARRAADVQERTLLQMVARARETDFGRRHDFAHVRSVADYQAHVPIRTYLDFDPLLEAAAAGAENVLWPGRPRYWVKTSGTTAGDKHIPVTPEAFASHRKGGWDAFLLAAERAGGAHLLAGPMLFLGGSTALAPFGNACHLGDLSGLVVQRLPPVIRSRYSPGLDLAGIGDWEQRIAAIAARVASQDLRLLSGMPSWITILFDRVAAARRNTGRAVRDMGQCWPNLRVFIHGGVAFDPYRSVFEAWVGRALARIEVYPASEGFVAVQTEPRGGMSLMLDYGIFYEFVPVEDLGAAHPRRHTVADVELGRNYALALTSPAGLWSYLLGDTVRFTARDPLRLAIVGRTRHFVNAFGENVIVEEVEQALIAACRATQAEVVEFSVAPRYPTQTEARGGHDWIVEFRSPPQDLDVFGSALDRRLQELNADYHTKRTRDVGMVAPRVIPVGAGTFYRWMRDRGKLGDQHKVPRVMNDRSVAEGLLKWADDRRATAGAQSLQPVS
jgi:hypothetical protein